MINLGSRWSPGCRRLCGGLVVGSLLSVTGCGREVQVFHPVGPVARIEEHLIWLSIILVLIIVVPVILLLWYIVNRYRDRPGNEAPYDPEWSESRTLEIIWWSIPVVIVGILGTFTARDTFALTRPAASSGTPLTVEVTSLDWKWLFQYPDQQIATVNYCNIPVGRPVQFVLTADSPMNSFWVPQLGGQEYAMPGMAMRLWLQADKAGVYYGHGANFTGQGYAKMTFHVIATRSSDFDQWVARVKSSAPVLTSVGYRQLAHPDIIGERSYSSYPPNLYRDRVEKAGGMYMKHSLPPSGTD